MLWHDNGNAARCWPTLNRFYGKGRRWVSHQVMPAICTYLNTPGRQFQPAIPFATFRACILTRDRSYEVGFTTIALVYGTNLPCLSSGRRHPHLLLHRPSSLLTRHLSRGAGGRTPVPDGWQSVQDYSARRDALFLGYIHFAFRA